MGFFDKALKNIVKSPLGKAALIGGLSMTPFGKAGITKLLPLLSKGAAMPLISKPFTSAATSYGLARLMRARNPEKAALWGALTTLPFLGSEAMAASKAATEAGTKTSMWDVLLNKQINAPGYGKGAETLFGKSFDTLTNPEKYRLAQLEGFKGLSPTQANIDKLARGRLAQGVPKVGAAKNLSYFMKDPTELKAMTEGTATGIAQFLPKSKFDVLNTLVPTLAGVYGARETDAQAWERIKKQRKQQLAFMYGVDPEEIEGEMDNPYYNITPPALDFKYANKGGVMNLDMGGDISGPGTGTSDSINAKVSDGEFIFTEQAVRNFGGGDRQKGAQRMYAMMNQLDPRSETPQEGMV